MDSDDDDDSASDEELAELREARRVPEKHGIEAQALARSPVMANKVRVFLTGNPFNPVEIPNFDWDGSVASVSAEDDPAEIEKVIARTVPWFHFPWGRRSDDPDRFHARFV